MMFFGDDADFAPTPERTLKQLKKAFPKCNIEGICSVQPEGDHYISTAIKYASCPRRKPWNTPKRKFSCSGPG